MRLWIPLAVLPLLLGVNTAAQVLDHYYLDPQNVDRVSKFRSCAGHHYGYDPMFIDLGLYEVETDPTEINRSMKHYFSPQEPFRTSGSNDTLQLHAPFEGVIYRVTDEGHDSGYVTSRYGFSPALHSTSLPYFSMSICWIRFHNIGTIILLSTGLIMAMTILTLIVLQSPPVR